MSQSLADDGLWLLAGNQAVKSRDQDRDVDPAQCSRQGGLLHDIGQWLPSYWLVQAGRVAVGGHAWGARGWLVVVGCTAILVAAAIYADRRDTTRV